MLDALCLISIPTYNSPKSYLNICISFNDGIELELGPDGQWEAELGGDVHIELVFLLLRLQALYAVQVPWIRLANTFEECRTTSSIYAFRPRVDISKGATLANT